MQRNYSRQQSRKKKPFSIPLNKQQLAVLSTLLPTRYSFSFHAKLPPPNQLLKKSQNSQKKPKITSNPQPESEKPVLTKQSISRDQYKERAELQKFYHCFEILNIIRTHPMFSVLLNIVDTKNCIYPEHVKRKIKQVSFQNVEKKIRKGVYREPNQFYRDLNRMFMTAYTSYRKCNEQYTIIEEIEIQALIYAQQHLKPIEPQPEESEQKERKSYIPVKQKIVQVEPSLCLQAQNQLNSMIKKMSEVHIPVRNQSKRKNTKKTKRETASFNIAERKFLAQKCKNMQGVDVRNLAIIISQQRDPPDCLSVDFQRLENKILKKVKAYVREFDRVPRFQTSTLKKKFKNQNVRISCQKKHIQFQIEED